MAELRELLKQGLERFEPSPDRGFDQTLGRVRRRQRNRRIAAAVVALVVFAGAITGIWASLRGGDRTVPAGPQPSVTATIEIAGGTTEVAVGKEGVWVATHDGAVQIDPATSTVVATVGLGVQHNHRIAVGEGLVWLANLPGDQPTGFDDTVTVIDPNQVHIVHFVEVPGVMDIVTGGGAMWALVKRNSAPEVWQIDPATYQVLARIPIVPVGGSGFLAGHIAFGAGAVWVSSRLAHPDRPDLIVVSRVDPRTHAVEQSPAALNGSQEFLASGADSVWLAAQYRPRQGSVDGFDPVTGKAVGRQPVDLPVSLADIAAAPSGVWLTDTEGRVWRIDPATGKLAGDPSKVGSGPLGVTADQTGAWVVGGGKAYRIDLCPASGCRHPSPIPSQTGSVPSVVQDAIIRESGGTPPGCPPIGMVAGRQLLTARNGDCVLPLSAEASGTLYGWIAPVAVDAAPGTELVAYNTWTPGGGGRLGGEPSIRVRSLRGPDDFVWADNAASFAWKPVTGAFAYFQITGEDAGGLPIGQVLVGASPAFRGAPIPSPMHWTTRADRWIVAAWGQDRLLVYRESEGEMLRLYVLDGPGQMWQLGPADANARLVAVSPDGSQAFVALGEGGDVVAVYDVASGRELSRLDMTGLIDPKSGFSYSVSYAGSWAGEVVAASGGPGLMLFQVNDGHVKLQRVLRIADGIYEPQLIAGVVRVVGWQHLQIGGKDRYRWLDCNLEVTACEAGPPTGTPLSLVYNPSRPEG